MHYISTLILIGTATLFFSQPARGSLCSIQCDSDYAACIQKYCIDKPFGKRFTKCVERKCKYVYSSCLDDYGCSDNEDQGFGDKGGY